jgi:N-acetylglucosamine repressor
MPRKENFIIENKSDQKFLKQLNLKKVLYLLWKHDKLSRVELSELGRLDKKTITNIVNELLQKNIIKESGYKSSGVGRPKQLLEINGKYGFHIGIELGITHITGVVLDSKGSIVAENNIDLRYTMKPEILLKMTKTLMHSLIKQSQLELSSFHGVGFAIPGFIDRESGTSILSENIPGWVNIPVKEFLMDELDLPFYIEDSSRTMALAEYFFGAGNNIEDFIVFDLGFGIGCGIIIGGNLYMGSNFKSGEIGHTIVNPNGPKCICGHSGCIESLASGHAIARNAINGLQKQSDSLLPSFTNGNINAITAKDVVLAAELGDKFSSELIKDAGKYLGIGIANALNFFNPSVIILGGSLVASGNILFDTIGKTIKKNSMQDIYNDVKILKSSLGHRASALGAAALSFQQLVRF